MFSERTQIETNSPPRLRVPDGVAMVSHEADLRFFAWDVQSQEQRITYLRVCDRSLSLVSLDRGRLREQLISGVDPAP